MLSPATARDGRQLLGQVADEGGRGGERHLVGGGRELPGEHAEQRRLARAVRPDDPDDVAGSEREIEVREEVRSPFAAARFLANNVALMWRRGYLKSGRDRF